jgi:hypothetical protein
MARPRKTTATTEPTTISIKDAVSQLSTTEQALRLALSHIRPDDFDTVKSIPSLDLEAVAKILNQPQLTQGATTTANSLENAPNAETSTQQESQTATEGATNDPIGQLAEQPQQKTLTQPAQAAQANCSELQTSRAKTANKAILKPH